MASPIRKRKRNEPRPAPAAPSSTRSIESFFKGQAAKRIEKKAEEKSHQAIDPASEDSSQILSDEALARKLQAEWDQEDRDGARTQTSENDHPPTEHSTTTPSIPKDNRDANIQPATQSPKKYSSTLSLQSSSDTHDTSSLDISFDQSPLSFNPAEHAEELEKSGAIERHDAPYALLTRAFVLANNTTSRIKIIDTLVNFLRILIERDPSSLLPAVWLATSSISPPYIDLELGLGGSSISKALKKVYGLDSYRLKTLYNKHGDPGDVAFEAKKKQTFTLAKPKPLTIKGVYRSLMSIATSKGAGSQENKQRIVEKLLQDTRGAEESRYIVRTLAQNLRIGAVKTTMLIALARAFLFSKPKDAEFAVRSQQEFAHLKKEELAEIYTNAEEIVKASYARHPNYGDLVPCLLKVGISEEILVRCGLELHVPLRPMLANITRDLTEMLTKLQGRDFSCEYKYDGQRAQVHCDSKGKVSIFSRHLELMTDKYPDLVSLVPHIRESVSSFILEGEVVAVDHESGALQPFQTLTNRAKKNVEIGRIEVNVCLFAFDLMYLNGEPLLNRPFRERRELLRGLFTQVPNRFMWVKSLDAKSSDSETVLEFFKNATESKCEGIMVKVLDNTTTKSDTVISEDQGLGYMEKEKASQPAVGSTKDNKDTTAIASRRKALVSTYEPDKRVDSWLKVKKDYSTSSSETLDLVPIAAWHGNGRKAKWWSPILLAVRNAETGSLQAVTKCMSGFTDKFYQSLTEKYAPGTFNVTIPGSGPSQPSYVEFYGDQQPDIWFNPQEVWEMAFADITLSPTYTAAIGLVSDERGLSLRFPRFLRVREDKSIDEASTADYLALLWRKQMERNEENREDGQYHNDNNNNDDDDIAIREEE